MRHTAEVAVSLATFVWQVLEMPKMAEGEKMEFYWFKFQQLGEGCS